MHVSFCGLRLVFQSALLDLVRALFCLRIDWILVSL